MASATQNVATYPEQFSDLAFQDAMLQGVSRTFALTIPKLPANLQIVVGNAYLLCRIADTIEDCTGLTMDEKHHYAEAFVSVVEGHGLPEAFAKELSPRLGDGTLPAERDLVRNTPRVIRLTRSFSGGQQHAVARCVRIMCEGMGRFQEAAFRTGLRDQQELDAYCYHVAGVVGEMLTELFCLHAPEVAAQKDKLDALAVSFGQGLQMTNILKDLWDDMARGVCWLPQSLFEDLGFDLVVLREGPVRDKAFEDGLMALVSETRRHLENGLAYALLIPKTERGIRTFCLWALGMAVLTLRKIHQNPGFASGAEIKISRRAVKGVMLAVMLCGSSNTLLRLVFRIAARGLPRRPSSAVPVLP